MSNVQIAGRGRTFTFTSFDPRYVTWHSTAGVYGFMSKGILGPIPLYFGECQSFANRLPNHERWDEAVRRGADAIIAMVTPAHLRYDIEQELIAVHNPVMNTHHRTSPTPLNGLFGSQFRK